MRTVIAAILWLLISSSACAADLTLLWDDPNPASKGVIKYTIYHATSPNGPFIKVADIPVGTLRYTATGLIVGPHAFHITASSATEESPPSETVFSGPSAPQDLIIIAQNLP